MSARNEAGFTLIEVMAALAVFSIAGIALMHVGAENTRAAVRLEDVTFARIVAGNVMIETTLAPVAPSLGSEDGAVTMAGSNWTWRRQITPAGTAGLRRVEISVSRAGMDKEAAHLSGFIGA